MQPIYSHPEVLPSPFLFDFRSNLPPIEAFLCINILTATNQSFWYLLLRGHHTATPAIFITLPLTPILTVDSACATFGRNIYVLGGSRDGHPTNTVQIFDARLNTWELAQRMGVPRQFASAGMIEGRMYIVGGHPSFDWWAEAFNPMSGQWSPVPRTSGIRSRTIAQSAILEGSFLETDNGGLLFMGEDLRPGNRNFWSCLKTTMGKMAMLDGVLYTYRLGGYITGHEQTTNNRFLVEGLDMLRELSPNLWKASRITNLSGMLCLVWKDNQTINCMGIRVTRSCNQIVLGSVAWRERVPLPSDGVNGELEYCGALEF